MSIDRTQQTSAIAASSLQRDLKAPVRADKTPPGPAPLETAETRVNINPQLQKIMSDSSQDVDNPRVTETRRAIEAGEYQIDFTATAKGMVDMLVKSL